MKTGASTSCLFPMLTEQSLDRLLALGVKNIEVFFNSPSECDKQFVREMKAAADAAGAKIISSHPYTSEMEGVCFFGSYSRRFDDEAKAYGRYFEACRQLGGDIFVLHGARSFIKLERDFYFERFCRLREYAATFGVRLLQENVARCHSGSLDFIRDMKAAIPDVEFVLDVKQSIRAGIDPFLMLDTMGKNLAHLHLSDHSADCDCLAPGDGDFDLEGFAKALKAADYKGHVMLELYSWHFDGEQKIADGIKLFDKFWK
ncbi:MAG: sugar phosphate isomerase/epimerase [Oscillospiraceae bacterium]|nr:sugar phosphate isomerase/epimerase [Oscillospiraceae bacterium]